MRIEFDSAEDRTNRAKHGLPLAFGAQVLADADHLLVATTREHDGEERFKAVGRVEGRIYTAVFTRRGAAIRFISVRRSNGNEEKAYREG